MLFNSYVFIFIFLPVVWCGFFALGRHGQPGARLAATWLAAASLFFYAWWDWHFLLFLGLSILFNFGMGRWMTQTRSTGKVARLKWQLVFAISTNLLLLGYFKYVNFFLSIGDTLFGLDTGTLSVVLPIGISFFTFTQIAFLVDVQAGKVREADFIHYILFVTYFPHLIAGPVLHHAEMMPQFRDPNTYQPQARAVAVGLTIFIIGLFKKVALADQIAPMANAAFAAAQGHPISFLEAWGGALAYTVQIYFDFSGYSDMAIGLSLAFNIRLPLNFDSPYKATSIIDFWRRWHMTLSRFLRDYLYIPLGGSRSGGAQRFTNLFITMVLGGLWHGAGMTFVVWGALHGSYLMVSHAWRALTKGRLPEHHPVLSVLYWMATFLAVVVAWVFFRADDMTSALAMLRGMADVTHIILPADWTPASAGLRSALETGGIVSFGPVPYFRGTEQVTLTLALLGVALLLPNVRQMMAGENVATGGTTESTTAGSYFKALRLHWEPRRLWAAATLLMFVGSMFRMTRVSQFLYFQF